jgi:hypothetical protein
LLGWDWPLSRGERGESGFAAEESKVWTVAADSVTDAVFKAIFGAGFVVGAAPFYRGVFGDTRLLSSKLYICKERQGQNLPSRGMGWPNGGLWASIFLQ